MVARQGQIKKGGRRREEFHSDLQTRRLIYWSSKRVSLQIHADRRDEAKERHAHAWKIQSTCIGECRSIMCLRQLKTSLDGGQGPRVSSAS